MKRTLVLALPLILLTAATAASPPSDPSRYLDQYVDTGVNPRDDFFQYAVGKWLHQNPIPANERSWGIGRVVQEETYQQLLGARNQ